MQEKRDFITFRKFCFIKLLNIGKYSRCRNSRVMIAKTSKCVMVTQYSESEIVGTGEVSFGFM